MSYFMREDSSSKSGGCRLKEIPHFTSPEKISQLNFSHHQIRIIPQHIMGVVNLQIIDLSHNKISRIEHIFGVSSLKFLNLSHNLISEVPEEIVGLTGIQNLDLGFNKIAILNNIKVLKSLVQLRMFRYKGFIEINLQGNQVLKKKGCRQIYRKWMNPSIEDYHRLARRGVEGDFITKTEKRVSKSLEPQGGSKENNLGQTNKNLSFHQNSNFIEVLKISKEQEGNKIKELANSTHPMLQNIRLSPNFTNYQDPRQLNQISNQLSLNIMPVKSETLKNGENIRDLSSIQECADSNNVEQWLSVCADRLKQLSDNFSLMMANNDVKTLQREVSDKIVEQSLYAKELVNISLDAVVKGVETAFGKSCQTKLMEQYGVIFEKIKEIHRQTLKIFKEKEHLPIKFYKPWVTHFRQLKNLVLAIPGKLQLQQAKRLRFQQIQDLVSISPDKNQGQYVKPSFEIIGSVGKCKREIDDLLFSRQKQDVLLLSDCKRSSSEKRLSNRDGEQECENCLMLRWQNSKIKEQKKEICLRVERMEVERGGYINEIKMLEDIKVKYLNLTRKQELIIEQLAEVKPSTYQNILLEQARTIEYMIKQEPMIAINLSNPQLKYNKGSQRHEISADTDKQKEVMKTRLSSGKNRKQGNLNPKKVSEFTIQGCQQQTENSSVVRSSSYFKNKNVIVTISRSEEGKVHADVVPEENDENVIPHRREIIVSQFNSEGDSNQGCSYKKLQSKGKKSSLKEQNLNRRSSIGSQQSRSKTKGSYQVNMKDNRQSTAKDVILISQQSSKKQIQSISPLFQQQFQRNRKNAMQQYIHSEQFQKVIEQKLSGQAGKGASQEVSRYNKFGGKIDLRNKSCSSLKKKQSKVKNAVSSADKENIATQRVKRTKTTQFLDCLYAGKNKEHPYAPMKSVEGESYKRYMQYHLRNNILDILSRKTGNCKQDLTGIQKRYKCITKSQKLISKREESELLKNMTGRSKYSEVNLTVR